MEALNRSSIFWLLLIQTILSFLRTFRCTGLLWCEHGRLAWKSKHGFRFVLLSHSWTVGWVLSYLCLADGSLVLTDHPCLSLNCQSCTFWEALLFASLLGCLLHLFILLAGLSNEVCRSLLWVSRWSFQLLTMLSWFDWILCCFLLLVLKLSCISLKDLVELSSNILGVSSIKLVDCRSCTSLCLLLCLDVTHHCLFPSRIAGGNWFLLLKVCVAWEYCLVLQLAMIVLLLPLQLSD